MKNKIASFLIAFVIVAGGARNAYADSARERLAAEGDEYFHAQDYPRAVAAYKMALSADPSLGRAYYGLALTYHQQEEWELAIAAFVRTRRDARDVEEAHPDLPTAICARCGSHRLRLAKQNDGS